MVGAGGENAMESTVSSPPELYPQQQQPPPTASLPLIQQQQQQQLMQNRYQQQRDYHHQQQHRASEYIDRIHVFIYDKKKFLTRIYYRINLLVPNTPPSPQIIHPILQRGVSFRNSL